MGAFDLPGIEHRLDFGQRLDDDADVFLLLGQPIDPGGAAGIDTAAKQPDRFVEAAACRQEGLDRQERADRVEIGFLARLAAGDFFRRFAVVDQTGDRLELPRRAAGIKRRHAELLDQDDAVALRVVQQDTGRGAAPHHVEHPLAAPAAGEQAVAKAHHVDFQMAGKTGLGAEDLDVGMRRGRR